MTEAAVTGKRLKVFLGEYKGGTTRAGNLVLGEACSFIFRRKENTPVFDVNLIRERREEVECMLRRRQCQVDLCRILELDDLRLSLVRKLNSLREERNLLSSEVKAAKDQIVRKKLIDSSRLLGDCIANKERELAEVQAGLHSLLVTVPNMMAPDVPLGSEDSENTEVRRWGEPTTFPFPVKDHVELGESLGILDIGRGSKVAGARTYYLKNEAVFLELALVRYAMDLLLAEGFTPIIPPVMVREEMLEGTRHYPFFRDQIYRIEGEGLGLVGTSEIPLAAYHAGEILDEESLPLKYAGFSPCYRTEVGSGGRDVRGLIRVHHFDKVEMFVFDHPENSQNTHEYMVSLEEKVYRDLGIPYRVVLICSGDMGPIAYKKYDIEFWHPSEAKYREITSCSNCTDFQARGLGVRFRPKGGGKTAYVHTLNGTAIAISRTLVAIFENYQQEDGSIRVPDVLRPYMPEGMERIGARTSR